MHQILFQFPFFPGSHPRTTATGLCHHSTRPPGGEGGMVEKGMEGGKGRERGGEGKVKEGKGRVGKVCVIAVGDIRPRGYCP